MALGAGGFLAGEAALVGVSKSPKISSTAAGAAFFAPALSAAFFGAEVSIFTLVVVPTPAATIAAFLAAAAFFPALGFAADFLLAPVAEVGAGAVGSAKRSLIWADVEAASPDATALPCCLGASFLVCFCFSCYAL